MNEEDKIVYQRLIYYNDEEHLAKRIIELQHCCKNLQSKIDKAIELIEKEDLITYLRETKDLELANEFEDLYKDLKEDK